MLGGVDTSRSVAVIGSGVAGLTAAYLLQRRYDVTLFEADDRLGGHAHTHELIDRAGRPQSVDTGFIVHNRRTYPQLLRLFAELGVPTQESEMSMSISCSGCGLEYAGGRGISGVLAQPRALARPAYLKLLLEVTRFHRQARAVLDSTEPDTTELDTTEPDTTEPDTTESSPQTLGQFIADGGYSPYFTAHFLLPVVSCVWSCGTDLAAEYPARYLFQFLANHGMLSIRNSPAWRTVTGGSQVYVRAAAKQLSAIRSGVAVTAVTRHPDGVTVGTADGDAPEFDAVVIATHPDQALRLLTDPTPAESAVLGAFQYSASVTALHSDVSLLPRTPNARACWNYRMSGCDGFSDQVHVTYDMNRLQRLDTQTPYLVTLNSQDQVDPASVIDTMHYEHPLFTPASVAAQSGLPSLNTGRTAFAGAYHGWGFHEDGCAAGVRAAAALGVRW